MKPKYIIFTGLLRIESRLFKSLTDLLSIVVKHNIKHIFILTWKGQMNKIKDKTRFNNFIKNRYISYIEYPQLTNNGGGNYKAQMFHYKKGLELINDTDSYVLKTRTDVYIQQKMIEKIFEKDLQIEDNIMQYKIWIPWAHKTKPFYLADEAFYSHYSSMLKLYNTDKIFDSSIIGQGITHIRRFINPFLKIPEYKRLIDIIINNEKEMMDMSITKSKEEMIENNIGRQMIFYYYKILTLYFDIDTPETTSVIFRDWNKKNNKLNKKFNLDLLYSNII